MISPPSGFSLDSQLSVPDYCYLYKNSYYPVTLNSIYVKYLVGWQKAKMQPVVVNRQLAFGTTARSI
jgi:hypothetical protein